MLRPRAATARYAARIPPPQTQPQTLVPALRCVRCAAPRRRARLRTRAAADAAPVLTAEDAGAAAASAAPPPALDLVGAPAAWATAPPPPPLLCAAEAARLLAARAAGAPSADVSLDLGRSTAAATLQPDGAALPGGLLLAWRALEAIADDANGVHQLLADAGAGDAALATSRVATFSGSTSRPVSLYPAPGGRGPPSALVAGFAMHRFGKGVDPATDTARKLAALSPLRYGARVLDICTGLGYTACAAAARGAAVTTLELDDAMQAMCAANPWSRLAAPLVPPPGSAAPGAGRSAPSEAAAAGGSITQLRGCAAALVAALPDGSFDRILHDPPSFALAGALYSSDFYADLARVLAPKARRRSAAQRRCRAHATSTLALMGRAPRLPCASAPQGKLYHYLGGARRAMAERCCARARAC